MNKLFKRMAIVTLILPLSVAMAYAKPGRGPERDLDQPHHGLFLEHMLHQVGLTEQQEMDLDKIVKSNRSEEQAYKKQQQESRMKLLKADKFNAKQAQALIDSQDAFRKVKKLNKMKMNFNMYHLLTPKQQAKLDLLFEMHQDRSRMSSHMGCKGNGPKMQKN